MVWCVVKSYERHSTVFYTVPKSWLYDFEGQTFVFYPSEGTFKDTTKSIISQTVHDPAWKDWPAEVIQHDFDTFLTAKNVEAEVADDKTAWERYIKHGMPKEFGVGKRLIRKPKKLAERSTTECDTDSSESLLDNRVMPSPPKKQTCKSPEKSRKPPLNDKASPQKVLAPTTSGKKSSPVKKIVQSPMKKLVPSPKKKLVQSPKKKLVPSPMKSVPKKATIPPKSIVLPSKTLKKTAPPANPLLSINKPSTSKDPVEFMPAPYSAGTSDSSIVEKRKSDTLAIEQWLDEHDSSLEQSDMAGNAHLLEATGYGPGTRQPTALQLTLFNAKKNVAIEKKLDRIWLHIEKSTDLEGQLKFSLPCKDYKRVVLVENLLQNDKTQFDKLVRVLKSQPSPTSRVGSMINVMLRFLLVDTAARKFCYTGSDKKFEFKSTNLNQAVTEAVLLMKRTENVSVELIGKAVGSWLSQAKKRIQNRSGGDKHIKKSSKQTKKKHLQVEDLQTSQSEGDQDE